MTIKVRILRRMEEAEATGGRVGRLLADMRRAITAFWHPSGLGLRWHAPAQGALRPRDVVLFGTLASEDPKKDQLECLVLIPEADLKSGKDPVVELDGRRFRFLVRAGEAVGLQMLPEDRQKEKVDDDKG